METGGIVIPLYKGRGSRSIECVTIPASKRVLLPGESLKKLCTRNYCHSHVVMSFYTAVNMISCPVNQRLLIC